MNWRQPPEQPPESSWRFIEELKAPLWNDHHWEPRPAGPDEVDVGGGMRLQEEFPDPECLLRTAYEDVMDFLRAGDIPNDRGYPVVIRERTMPEESFRLHVDSDGCTVEAGDTEGVRRALFELETMMLRSGSPVLPVGSVQRTPFVKRRISRCFFGPIKRPPLMRDELLDDRDYYPDHYLNRLAHEGVNGLWLTVEFRDLCATSMTPEYGQKAERRFAKLRRTVETCRQYGIRTYIFCIEPRAWGPEDAAILERHPELTSGPLRAGRKLFCPFSEAAQRYLREAVSTIFEQVPALGGLINISHGERPTTCLSAVSAVGAGGIHCPVCREKEPWEILHAALSAMEKGIHDAAPNADLISWLYMPQPQGADCVDLAEWVYDIPAHTPPGVILQFNFESGVRRTVFGKELVGGDYWLSHPGPSDRFERVAATARQAGTALSAKIQTGCSHEVATVPYVPVPGMLYRKFSAMRDLGVSCTMLCWYFGNYPGLMNAAAGALSFEPFPQDESRFLRDLARRWWRQDADTVARAWQHFASGYADYPLTNLFQYYGPMHDGPVWPLHLEPVDAPLSPTWQLGSAVTGKDWPPSGDRVGEAFGEALDLAEVIALCEGMVDEWNEGLALLRNIASDWRRDPERQQDIGVAETLAILFNSGLNILRFYALREDALRTDGTKRLEPIEQMKAIVRDEIRGNRRLLTLCQADSRLGFHSEAEGFKFFPEKIHWRMRWLEDLLEEDFQKAERGVRNGDLLYPHYTGAAPRGPSVTCAALSPRQVRWDDDPAVWPCVGEVRHCAWGQADSQRYRTSWRVCRGRGHLYVFFRCAETPESEQTARMPEHAFPVSEWRGYSAIALRVEPRRLWPCLWFAVAANGWTAMQPWGPCESYVQHGGSGWYGALRIPWTALGREPDDDSPLRIDVQRSIPGAGFLSWMPQHPLTPRLRLGSENPRDLGWLLLA